MPGLKTSEAATNDVTLFLLRIQTNWIPAGGRAPRCAGLGAGNGQPNPKNLGPILPWRWCGRVCASARGFQVLLPMCGWPRRPNDHTKAASHCGVGPGPGCSSPRLIALGAQVPCPWRGWQRLGGTEMAHQPRFLALFIDSTLSPNVYGTSVQMSPATCHDTPRLH